MDKLTKQQKAFLSELQNLTEKGVICWKRQGDQLVATMSLALNLDFLDCPDPVRSLAVSGGPECEVYLPISEDVLLEQWAEIECFAEDKSAAVVANVAD